MKTDAKSWTPNRGELISPHQSYQTLCEGQSGSFAVQASPDFQTPNKSVLSSQSVSAETEIPRKDCAKAVCVACGNRFNRQGKENCCESCLNDDVFRRTCRECFRVFYADDPFDTHCSFCYDTNNTEHL